MKKLMMICLMLGVVSCTPDDINEVVPESTCSGMVITEVHHHSIKFKNPSSIKPFIWDGVSYVDKSGTPIGGGPRATAYIISYDTSTGKYFYMGSLIKGGGSEWAIKIPVDVIYSSTSLYSTGLKCDMEQWTLTSDFNPLTDHVDSDYNSTTIRYIYDKK